MSLRIRRHLISFGYFALANGLLALVFWLVSLCGGGVGVGMGLLILVNHLLVFLLPGYRRAIQRLFLGTQRCPNCGLVIDLVGMWACECGFNQVRHVLARCPWCKTYVDRFRCPQCEGSIRV